MTTKITRVLILLLIFCASTFAQSNDINLLLSTLPAGKDPQRYKGYVEPQFKAVTQRSLYLTMRDGAVQSDQPVVRRLSAASEAEKLPETP